MDNFESTTIVYTQQKDLGRAIKTVIENYNSGHFCQAIGKSEITFDDMAKYIVEVFNVDQHKTLVFKSGQVGTAFHDTLFPGKQTEKGKRDSGKKMKIFIESLIGSNPDFYKVRLKDLIDEYNKKYITICGKLNFPN